MNQDLRVKVLTLYKMIRKVHVRLLPPEMRDIADPMLKQEFRSHLDSDDSQTYMGQFVEKWIDYYEQMSNVQNIEELGRDMTEDEKAFLSEEQKESLSEIKKLVTEL